MRIRIKKKLSKSETKQFLDLVQIKLENLGYKVYFSGDQFIYNNLCLKVKENEVLIAIK